MGDEYQSSYNTAGTILRAIIKENGQDILKDVDKLYDALRDKKCDNTIAYQILLVIKSSNISRYFSQFATGISMVDVNNIIASAEKETGLSKKSIKSIVSCIFYGLSLPTTLSTVIIPTDDDYQVRDSATGEFFKYGNALSIITKAINDADVSVFKEHADELEQMSRAGHPTAHYLKGLCYYKGFCTEQDNKKAMHYLKLAAKGGNVNANAMLGDLYFNDDEVLFHYDLAFEHYTVIGAVGLSKKRQQNVKVILEQKKVNFLDLSFAIILWIIALVFNILLGSGVFSIDSANHWVCASFSIAFSTIFVALSALNLFAKKFNSIKWVIPCIVFVTMLFACFAL